VNAPAPALTRYGSRIDDMLDTVASIARRTPRPVHTEVYPGPGPGGRGRSFVVASFAAGGQTHVAWEDVSDLPDGWARLLEWNMKAHLRGLAVRSGIAAAAAWPLVDESIPAAEPAVP
jgi:hypothetical protein